MSPAKPGPVSEHRESDHHQSKDAYRDNRFRCSIHRCLQQASGRRDPSLACEPLFIELTHGSYSGRFSQPSRRAGTPLPDHLYLFRPPEEPFDNPRDVVSRYSDVLEQPVVEVLKRGGRPPPLPALQRTYKKSRDSHPGTAQRRILADLG